MHYGLSYIKDTLFSLDGISEVSDVPIEDTLMKNYMNGYLRLNMPTPEWTDLKNG